MIGAEAALLGALSGAALAVPPGVDPMAGCTFSPEMLQRLQPVLDDDLALTVALRAWRAEHPELFAPTLPLAGPVRLPGEFEPRSGVVISWPDEPDLNTVAVDLLVAVAREATPWLLVETPASAQQARLMLELAGLERGTVQIVQVPYDSLWVRDFGPVFVEGPGGLAVVDADYSVDCIADDALPGRIHDQLGVEVSALVRTELVVEGGNLLSDGAGTCFTTTGLAARNGVTDWAQDGGLARWYGCQQVIELPPLEGEVIDHVDLMLAVADAHTLLLGAADPKTDPRNARVLDEAAAILGATRSLDGSPWRVVRVPMVPIDRSVRGDGGGPLVRTWLNLVPVNGVVAVPVFVGADPVVQYAALEAIAGAFPGRRLVPVKADAVAPLYGTLHCLSQTVPRPR